MKIYACDACGVKIENPYDVRMKEFNTTTFFTDKSVLRQDSKKKRKIHLCGTCFRNLNKTSENTETAKCTFCHDLYMGVSVILEGENRACGAKYCPQCGRKLKDVFKNEL